VAQIAREAAFARLHGFGALDLTGMATWMGPLAAALLVAAVLPFARPLLAYVRRR
jgi:hypothetical protein